jgi:hypothetical protein
MRLLLSSAFLLLGLTVRTFSADGVVTTVDGRRVQGRIEFTNDALIVRPPQGGEVRIAGDNIARARFATNVAATTQGKGAGLLGVYYASSNLTGAAIMRLDDAVNFRWAQSPLPGLPHDGFSVRWMAYLEAPATDDYTLHFGTDDGGRLYLDGQLVADHWARHDYAETNVAVRLQAGERKKLTVEHYDARGPAQARLFWSSSSMPRTLLPEDRLYPASFDALHAAKIEAGAGLLATYYNSDDFSSNSVTQIDPQIDFHWRTNTPPSGIDSNRFSVRWTGSLRVTNSGPYQFHLQAALPVRLFINDRLVSDPWRIEFEQTRGAMLQAGEPCELRLELRVTNNAVPVKLSWSGPGFPKTLITADHLSPGVNTPGDLPAIVGAAFPAGVVLASGIIVDAPIAGATRSAIQLGGLFAKQSVPLARVTHIFVQPLTREFVLAMPKGRTGVLLKNRDFIDGEFAGIESGRVRITSVLFGNRTFDLAKEVAAVVLRSREPAAWKFSLRARDGTALYGAAPTIGETGMSLRGASEFVIPADSLLEVNRAESRQP